MKASDLDKIIDIYELVLTETLSGFTNRKWKKKYTTRARVNYSSGGRTIENDEIFFMVDREFIMRHYVPIVDTDIIIWNDEKWRVLSIDHNREFNDIIVRTTKIIDEDIIVVPDDTTNNEIVVPDDTNNTQEQNGNP